jgi:hypothetical protein
MDVGAVAKLTRTVQTPCTRIGARLGLISTWGQAERPCEHGTRKVETVIES